MGIQCLLCLPIRLRSENIHARIVGLPFAADRAALIRKRSSAITRLPCSLYDTYGWLLWMHARTATDTPSWRVGCKAAVGLPYRCRRKIGLSYKTCIAHDRTIHYIWHAYEARERLSLIMVRCCHTAANATCLCRWSAALTPRRVVLCNSVALAQVDCHDYRCHVVTLSIWRFNFGRCCR